MFAVIFGDRHNRLPAGWTKESALAIAGEATVDASAGAGPGATFTFVCVGGDLKLRVPPGSNVRESGLSVLGDRRIDVTPGTGPDIAIKVFGLFVDVEVTDGAV